MLPKNSFLLLSLAFLLILGVGCRDDLQLIKNNLETPSSDFQTENICFEEGELADPNIPCCAGLYRKQIDDAATVCSKLETIENSAPHIKGGVQGAQFLDFNKKDYDAAHTLPARIVFLYFNSVNCSTCFKELAELRSAFEELKKDPNLGMNLVGFIVDMDDKYTDLDEKALAKEFKATKHTKVFFAKENGISQFEGQWDKQMFLDQIKKIKASWNN